NRRDLRSSRSATGSLPSDGKMANERSSQDCHEVDRFVAILFLSNRRISHLLTDYALKGTWPLQWLTEADLDQRGKERDLFDDDIARLLRNNAQYNLLLDDGSERVFNLATTTREHEIFI